MLKTASKVPRTYLRNLAFQRLPLSSNNRCISSASENSWLSSNAISTGSLTLGLCKFRMGHLSESSVVAQAGGSMVHCAVNSAKPEETKEDFLPLTVDYRSRDYSFGAIPELTKRRERHGGDDEILVARFVDRAVRSLFPKGYVQDVQVLVTSHSADGIHDPTVLAVNAASLALLNSRQPWFGPVGCVRVGMVDNKLKVNPTVTEMESSPLDLLYAGTTSRAVMIEAGALQIQESIMKEALQLAHEAIQEIIASQLKLVACENEGKTTEDKLSHFSVHGQLLQELADKYWQNAVEVYNGSAENLSQKEDRSQLEGALRAKMLEDVNSSAVWSKQHPIVIGMTVDYLLHKAFRSNLLTGETDLKRSDGRSVTQLRDIDCAINVLPAVHGSSYFSRGDTHVLCSTTLGPEERARKVIPLNGSGKEKLEYFMLHYDFPPYCTGEIGNATASNRRMVGHGNLAEKAVKAVLPSFQEFPYTVRVFAECTSSNGSSSMASSCGATLSLLDAGVPIKALVAGVSVGLFTDDSFLIKPPPTVQLPGKEASSTTGKYVLLKDILGSEDHHGDMDFKIAGSHHGITAIQLDVKLEGGVPLSILNEAIDLAKIGRTEILTKMQTLHFPKMLKPHVPRAELIKFDPERMTQLIGMGGEMIKFIESLYKVQLHILEDGLAYLYGTNAKAVQEAKELIEDIAVIVKEGMVVNGVVQEVKDFGALVQINRGQTGLLHISHISHDPEVLKKPLSEVLRKGQKFPVEIIQVDKAMGLVKLSRKSLLNPQTSVPDNLENIPVEITSEESILPKISTIPPKSWSKEFFLQHVAPAVKAEDAKKNEEKHHKNNDNNNNHDHQKHKYQGKKHPHNKPRPHPEASTPQQRKMDHRKHVN